MAGLLVDGGEGGTNLRVGQREEPSHGGRRAVCDMQAENLDEHHLGEVLAEKDMSGLRVSQDRHHAFEVPPHGCAICILLEADDGRKNFQQHICVFSGEAEDACEHEATAATLPRVNLPVRRPADYGSDVDGIDLKAACEGKCSLMRKSDKVARLEEHRIRNAFNTEPALAACQGEAKEEPIRFKAKGPISTCVDAARHEAAGPEQRQHV